MLHIINLEEIQDMLLRIPELINDFERHNPNFVKAVKDWLVQTEKICISNRLTIAADIAVLRGQIISVEHGVIPQGMVFKGKISKRKIKDASAADVLRKTEELISSAVKGASSRIEEGESYARQILMLAQKKGLIPDHLQDRRQAEKLQSILMAINSDPELGPALTQLKGLVGSQDAVILIDRILVNL